jgi:hypothetical protein
MLSVPAGLELFSVLGAGGAVAGSGVIKVFRQPENQTLPRISADERGSKINY